ncbi:unnamed protein product, partial [Meganyctiphanes norvegica]
DTDGIRVNQDEAADSCDFDELLEVNSESYDFLTDDEEDQEDHTDIPIPSGPQGRKIRRELKRRQRKNRNKAKAEQWLQEKAENEEDNKSQKEAGEEESSRIPGHLTCPICLDLLHNPCRTQPCKHLFCESCLRQMGGENTACPLCREVIGQCKPDKDISEEIRVNFPVLCSVRQEFERKQIKFERPLPWTRDHRFNQARSRWHLDIQNWDIRNLVIEEYRNLPRVQKFLFWAAALKIVYYIGLRLYRRFYYMSF